MQVRYISWADTTGYAIAAKSYLRAFHRAGFPVTWSPMLPRKRGYRAATDFSTEDPELAALLRNDGQADTVVIHTVPEYYPARIEEARKSGQRVFGYTVWELERLPDHWPDILNRLDGVIVPCTWNVGVFKRSGVTVPVHVVPHLPQLGGVQPPTASVGPAIGGEAAAPDRFVFYTIGYWSNRKAPDLVVKAFLRAFNAEDPVSLVIKTSRNDITRRYRHWRNLFCRRHPSPKDTLKGLTGGLEHPPIEIIADETLSEAQMLALHRRGDCFVSLARTEGWGLGAFDAARLGKPVIMTGYGGQREFLDPEYAWLVDYRMVPVHEPTWSDNYRPTDLWAEPDLDQAVIFMRQVFENKDEATRRARSLADDIAVRFSEEAIMAAWTRALA